MKYFFLLVLFWSPLSVAQDGKEHLGLVRILNTNPPSYDRITNNLIPDSQNSVFIVEDIVLDPGNPNEVWLMVEGDGPYNAFLIQFNSVNFDNDISKKFKILLQKTPGFQIDLNKEDLIFETIRMSSFGKVKAKKVNFYSDSEKNFVNLKNILCPLTREERRWWDLGKYLSVREDCP